jgi:hypothetical protein
LDSPDTRSAPVYISPESRALELFKVISEGGNPKVFLMGKEIL